MLMLSILHSAIPQKIRHKSSNEIAESHDQLAISQRRKRIVCDIWGADKAFDVSKWHWRISKQWITNWTPVQYLIRGFHISSWPSSVWPATSLCPALQVRKRVKHEIATIPFMTDRESIEVLLKISRARLSAIDTNFKHLFSARPSSLPADCMVTVNARSFFLISLFCWSKDTDSDLYFVCASCNDFIFSSRVLQCEQMFFSVSPFLWI